MEKSAPDFADGFHASAGTHAQVNSLHSQFVLQTLFAHIDVLGNQVVEAGRIHSTLIEDTQQADATHGSAPRCPPKPNFALSSVIAVAEQMLSILGRIRRH